MLKNTDYTTTCFVSSLSSDDVKVSFCPFNFLCKSFQILIYRDVFFSKYSRPLTDLIRIHLFTSNPKNAKM